MTQPTRRRELTTQEFLDLGGADAGLVTINDAAELIEEHPDLVRQWVQLGHVPYVKLDGRVFVPFALVARREVEARRSVQQRGGRRRRTAVNV